MCLIFYINLSFLEIEDISWSLQYKSNCSKLSLHYHEVISCCFSLMLFFVVVILYFLDNYSQNISNRRTLKNNNSITEVFKKLFILSYSLFHLLEVKTEKALMLICSHLHQFASFLFLLLLPHLLGGNPLMKHSPV